MDIIRVLFWAVAFILRAILIVIGWVLPVHIMYNTSRTKGMNLWERYVENSWRNPTPYLRGVFKQPVPEVKPNPDDKVRVLRAKEASRTMRHGLYWEYWYLKRRDDEFCEFRIGWKFVDGDDTFWPTLQLRCGN